MENTETGQPNTEALTEKIREFISREFLYDRPEIELTDDLHLFDRGVIDSIGVIRLINFMRDEFKIEINPEDVLLENFETVARIAAMLQSGDRFK